jgi:hypothetical protein
MLPFTCVKSFKTLNNKGDNFKVEMAGHTPQKSFQPKLAKMFLIKFSVPLKGLKFQNLNKGTDHLSWQREGYAFYQKTFQCWIFPKKYLDNEREWKTMFWCKIVVALWPNTFLLCFNYALLTQKKNTPPSSGSWS